MLYVEWWGKLNPEPIIVANPDVIVMTGYESGSSDDAMVMGQGVDEELAKQRLAGFKERIDWSSIAAVKNNRMYALTTALVVLFSMARCCSSTLKQCTQNSLKTSLQIKPT
ncbi:hypothetical protein [Vibrio sp. V43_P6S15P86]|uniref:hypothetical protein n=1 Tax=Vibrio sp. V43_P6S15P86 TaxID=1938694 RepID=UPI001F29C1C9|nr:hypothetical protein [Vibrio sp. V43_P6S15P86]